MLGKVPSLRSYGVGDCRDECVFGLPGVETGVLDDDGRVALDDGRILSGDRERLGSAEVIEAQMSCASGFDGHQVGPAGSRSAKNTVMVTLASVSPVFRIAALSWL